MQAALAHHQAGRLQQAEALYRQILHAAPNHPDALHFLGLLTHQMGNADLAVELIRKAIQAKPSSPIYYNNLGNTLKDQGKLDAAVESYQQALALRPELTEAHYNLGLTLQAQDKLDAAIESFRQVLSLKPGYTEAHSSLGLALQAQGKLDAAVASYRKALSLKPDYAQAHNNLGYALQITGQIDAAIACFQEALALKPNYAQAQNNLGNALQALGKLDAALEHYRRAISIKTDFAEAHNNLGTVFRDKGQLVAAIASFQQALVLKPDYAEAHNNLGAALQNQGNLNAAIESYHRALSFKPDYADAYSNLLFLHAYHATLAPRDYLSLAHSREQACVPEQDRQAAHKRAFERPPLAGRRLRIGYVSGDFRQHAISYFVERLFTHHDRSRIELFAYANSSVVDAITARLQSLADHWIPIAGISDAAIRDRIEADGIDLLIDLSGHTRHHRLDMFARRTAPVQVHYLGYFASTGLSEMDYFIGDDILTPPQFDSQFSEQVWRLPRVWVSYDGKADAPTPDWHPSRDGTAWLGSFNNLGKLTPATLALWAQVLHALPEGKLLLKTKDLADASNCRRILDGMAGHGIAAERIELQPGSITPGWQEHMAYYNRLDIALDPVGGVGGGTTTCDALWMGVPLITLEGDRMASRMTASMLNAVAHPEWVARSEAEYVDKVVALARDVPLRQTLRPAQRERMARSPLCDARDLTMKLECAYLEMSGLWQANNTVPG